MKMKNYLAFYGDIYYASGGMHDFIGDYNTKEEAIKAIEDEHERNRQEDISWEFGWGHVWDSINKEKIYLPLKK